MNIIYNLAFLVLFQFLSVSDQALKLPPSSPRVDSKHEQKRDKDGTAYLVFRSADGGQTWQDISKGLPEPTNKYGLGFFADDNGLYLAAEKGLYHSKPNSKVPFWKKEIYPGEHASISPAKTGIFAYNYWGGISERTNGTSVWSTKFSSFQEKVRTLCTVFESAKGAIFIGTDKGLFKSTDSGKTWKDVYVGLVTKLAESNGVLLATSLKGIIRSTDDGENWTLVISEGGVGVVLEKIKGGFAAITRDGVAVKTTRVRTSYDGGKTWQLIDAGLPAESSITSIIQVGENFYCGHPTGIYKSSDKGKTWKLIRPSIKDKVYHLSVSGNVIYAIPLVDGC